MKEPMQLNEKEHQDLIKTWYEFKPNTPKELAEFAEKLLGEYRHDYGTICHAAAAIAHAGAWLVDRDQRQGGLTGFQGSVISHLFVSKWLHIDSPYKRVMYEQMLYPQYKDDFEKVIPKSVFDWLQKQAKKKLAEKGGVGKVRDHWQSIVDGKVPFGYKVKD